MNEYWVIPLNKIKDIEKKVFDSDLPHEKFHYAISEDGLEAIIQGNFTPEGIKWLKDNTYTKVGAYTEGKAEKKVSDYLDVNKEKWQPAITKA